jgi:hypothetical protein
MGQRGALACPPIQAGRLRQRTARAFTGAGATGGLDVLRVLAGHLVNDNLWEAAQAVGGILGHLSRSNGRMRTKTNQSQACPAPTCGPRGHEPVGFDSEVVEVEVQGDLAPGPRWHLEGALAGPQHAWIALRVTASSCSGALPARNSSATIGKSASGRAASWAGITVAACWSAVACTQPDGVWSAYVHARASRLRVQGTRGRQLANYRALSPRAKRASPYETVGGSVSNATIF